MNGFEELALRFTLAGAHVLWIGALVAIAALIVERLVKSAAARHVVHLVGLLVTLAALPIAVIMAPIESQPELATQAALVSTPPVVSLDAGSSEPITSGTSNETPTLIQEPDNDMVETIPVAPFPAEVETSSKMWQAMAPWVAGLYGLGLLAMTLRLCLGFAGSVRLRKRSEMVAQGEWIASMQRMARAMNLCVQPALQWSSEVTSPVVMGLLKPAVLLPIALANRLTPAQVEAVLAHEMAHLCRRDTWTVAVQRLTETVLFFHPAVWWMSRRLETAREQACDDLVLAAGCDPANYAETLLVCSECRLEQAPPIALWASRLAATGRDGAPLRQRILRLLGQGGRDSVRLGRIGWLLAMFAITGGVMVMTADSWSRESKSTSPNLGLPELSQSENAAINTWVTEVLSGQLAEKDFVRQLKETGPQSVRSMIPLMRSGETDRLAMKGMEAFLDDDNVVDFLADVLSNLSKAEQPSPNVQHCCLLLLGKSKDPKHVDLAASFLDSAPIAAMHALEAIGGANARDHLIGAFDQVSTDKWWLLAEQLRNLGDPAAIPELKRRLAMIENPPNEAFPRRSVSAFTGAISALSGIEESTTWYSWQQGQRFIYPFNSPGTPKTFSVAPPTDHYVKLPRVNPNEASSKQAIWDALKTGTSGPGFILDGDEMVLFHGLKATPLWEDGPPFPTTLNEWIDQTSHASLLESVRQETRNDRVTIPQNGLLLAKDPKDQLYVVKLEKRHADFEYSVSIRALDPLRQLVKPTTTENAFTSWSACTLHDLESKTENGALNISRNHLVTMDDKRWRSPTTDAVLVAEFAANGVALGIAGAKEFVLAVASPDVALESLVSLLTKARAERDEIHGHQVLKQSGAIFHHFANLESKQCFAFAAQMPNGPPIAGLLQMQEVNHPTKTVDIRYRFLWTKHARQIFRTAKRQPIDESLAQAMKALRQIQSDDGSMPRTSSGPAGGKRSGFESGVTALAGMAFLQQRGNQKGSPNREPMLRALRYVLDCQSASGWFQLSPTGNDGSLYHHAIAVWFLAHVRPHATETLIEQIDKALPVAVEKIIAAQAVPKVASARGGWRYAQNSKDSDLSCTAWAVQALMAARNANIEIPNRVLSDAVAYVEQLQNPDGGFAYVSRVGGGGASNVPRTAMGLYCLQVAGKGNSEMADKATQYLLRESKNPQEHYEFYGILWGAEAMRHRGGDDADQYESWLVEHLLGCQQNCRWRSKLGDILGTLFGVLALGLQDSPTAVELYRP